MLHCLRQFDNGPSNLPDLFVRMPRGGVLNESVDPDLRA